MIPRYTYQMGEVGVSREALLVNGCPWQSHNTTDHVLPCTWANKPNIMGMLGTGLMHRSVGYLAQGVMPSRLRSRGHLYNEKHPCALTQHGCSVHTCEAMYILVSFKQHSVHMHARPRTGLSMECIITHTSCMARGWLPH